MRTKSLLSLSLLSLTLLFALIVPASLLAEDAAQTGTAVTKEKSADEVARELANPNTSLASLTFRNQYRWYKGDLPGAGNQSNYTQLFQPVFPFTLEPTASGGAANFFVRPAIPFFVEQPTFDAGKGGFKGVTALGDIGFDIGYGVTEKSGLLWGYGMVGTLPAATDSAVAGKQLRLGPEALFAKFEKWGVYGVLPTHQWDVAGWGDSGYYNTTSTQFFLKFLPGGGWHIGTIPIVAYDWKSSEWTVPLNLTFGRTIKLGKTPVKLEFEVNYYVKQPNAIGPEWMIALNVTPVVTNIIDQWFKGK